MGMADRSTADPQPLDTNVASLDTNIPFPTLALVLENPETVKRNVDRGAIISLYRWNCGCRAVAESDICDVKWCALHGSHFGSH